MTNIDTLELGALLGRSQALRLIATHCGAADAQCLKAIKDGGNYKELGLSWEDFCTQYLGIHRSTAEDIIRRFEEFGPAYFKLAELMRITPAAFRQIESAVSTDDECLVVRGESIPINRENAQRLIEAVGQLVTRNTVEKAASIDPLIRRLQNTIAEISRHVHKTVDPADRFLLARSTEEASEALRLATAELRA
jgi:hypothetical protein